MQVNLQKKDRHAVPPPINPPSESIIIRKSASTMQPRNLAQKQLYWYRQSEVCVSPSLRHESPVIPSTLEPAPLPTSEFSSAAIHRCVIHWAVIHYSSAALSPISTFVFGSSLAPSCSCDIRAPDRGFGVVIIFISFWSYRRERFKRFYRKYQCPDWQISEAERCGEWKVEWEERALVRERVEKR